MTPSPAHRTGNRLKASCTLAALVVASAISTVVSTPAAAAGPLALDVFTAEPAGFGVTSTLVYGPTEALLVDAQFRASDATRLAARIRAIAPNRKLTAIVVSHPHPDHVFGLPTLLREFPGTPVYLSREGLAEFDATVAAKIATWSKIYGQEIPTHVDRPQLAPARFSVDGETLELVSGIQGDGRAADHSYLWIPSLRAIVASDLAYSGVHVWLADSTAATRTAWRTALSDLKEKRPSIVVAGHKGSTDLADSPASLAFTQAYIDEFEAAGSKARTADELVATLSALHPELGLVDILKFAAQAAFRAGGSGSSSH